MWKTTILVLLLGASLRGMAQSQAQADMTYQYGEADKMTIRVLDSLCGRIRQLYAADTLFLRQFSRAQAAWKAYRDAQMAARFPAYPEPNYYGSMGIMCAAIYARTLTEQRIRDIEPWLQGAKEGDCGSSRLPSSRLPPYQPYDPARIDAIRDKLRRPH